MIKQSREPIESESLETDGDVGRFFNRRVKSVFASSQIDPSEPTIAYLASVLRDFVELSGTDPSRLGFDRPVAFDVLEAKDTGGGDRISKYVEVAEHCLLNCSLFEEYLTRRCMSAKYYRDIGAVAYHKLSEWYAAKPSAKLPVDIFGEVSSQFEPIVDVLSAVNPTCNDTTDMT